MVVASYIYEGIKFPEAATARPLPIWGAAETRTCKLARSPGLLRNSSKMGAGPLVTQASSSINWQGRTLYLLRRSWFVHGRSLLSTRGSTRQSRPNGVATAPLVLLLPNLRLDASGLDAAFRWASHEHPGPLWLAAHRVSYRGAVGHMPNVLKQQEGAADVQWPDAGPCASQGACMVHLSPLPLRASSRCMGDRAAASLRVEVAAFVFCAVEKPGISPAS